MAKTAALSAAAGLLLATGWMRLEQPHAGGASAFVLLALAIVVALARPAWLKAPALVAAVLAALNIAFADARLETASLPDASWIPSGLPAGLAEGFLSFYDVQLPLDPRLHPFMHGVLLLAVFGFSLATALLVAGRRPLAAALVVVVGAGWPATLEPGGGDVLRGGLMLLVCLLLLLGCRSDAARRAPYGLAAAAGATLLAVALASSPAAARSGLLDWQRWDPYTKPDGAVNVTYVWRSNYDGLHFPKHATIVFTVSAPSRPLYWRATTLDRFDGRGWDEAPVSTPAERVGDREVVPSDAPLPRSAREQSASLVRQEVTMRALRDTHLVAASVPVAYRTDGLGLVRYTRGGTAFTPYGVARGASYTVWSRVLFPQPKRLRRSPAAYPHEVRKRFLAVAPGVVAPPFGMPGRQARLAGLLRRHAADVRVGPYARLAREAERLTAGAPHAYSAAVALEAWFRLGGSFRYDEQPPIARGTPPLVDFVVRTHRGYCQHYAGAMALMLRYLGIPARVAAGFTSGSYSPTTRTWTVTDHDAHTWVEVWFAGIGWLPFDPTPTRGGLAGSYSAASTRFDAGSVIAALGGAALALKGLQNRLGGRGDARITFAPPTDGGHSRRGAATAAARVLGLAGLGLLAALVLPALGKWAHRRRRRATGDPRRLAAGYWAELAGFLSDQGVSVAPTATSAEVDGLLREHLDVDGRRFGRAFDSARFGPGDRAEEAAARCAGELGSLLSAIRARLTPLQRLRGLVSLRSLGTA